MSAPSSDTPRTDSIDGAGSYMMMKELARTLERELAALTARAESFDKERIEVILSKRVLFAEVKHLKAQLAIVTHGCRLDGKLTCQHWQERCEAAEQSAFQRLEDCNAQQRVAIKMQERAEAAERGAACSDAAYMTIERERDNLLTQQEEDGASSARYVAKHAIIEHELRAELAAAREEIERKCARCGSDNRPDLNFHCSTCYGDLRAERDALREEVARLNAQLYDHDKANADEIERLTKLNATLIADDHDWERQQRREELLETARIFYESAEFSTVAGVMKGAAEIIAAVDAAMEQQREYPVVPSVEDAGEGE